MKRSDARDVLEVLQAVADNRFIPQAGLIEASAKVMRCLEAVGKFDDDKPTSQQLADLKKINERRSQ